MDTEDAVAGVVVDATIVVLPDGRRLAVASFGDPAGVPVFGFHGTPGSRAQLAPVDQAAARAGVRLLVPDRPGYGLSTPAPGRDLPGWARDVAALAHALGVERCGVLGVSGGGPHALACAAELGPRVAATATVSSLAPTSRDELVAELSPRVRPLAAFLLRRVRLLELVVRLVLLVVRWFPDRVLRAYRRWLPPADRRVVDRPDLRRQFLAELRHRPPSTAAAVAQDLDLFTRPWQVDLGAITSPVDVWHGDADRTVSITHATRLTRLLADAELHVWPGGGHLAVVEHAGEVLRTLGDRIRAYQPPAAQVTHASSA